MSVNDGHAGRDSPHAAEPDGWEHLDHLLEDLPPGYPILSDEDRDDFSKYHNPGPRLLGEEEAWQNCARAIAKHDADLCKGYREEIDTLLVFAGLFSAVVTAFTAESYKWLQDDQNAAAIVLLSHIARSVAPNDTAGFDALSANSGLPSAAAARINAYWFVALTLSLSAALVAILCKQWIREFERNDGGPTRQCISIRQVKFEGFQRYGVGGIIAALPLLLQLSLAIFGLGVLELLWRLHTAVAIAVCIPAFIAFAFYITTAVLPAIQATETCINGKRPLCQYPFKSSQAWMLVRAFLTIWYIWYPVRRSISGALASVVYACLNGFQLRDVYFFRPTFSQFRGYYTYHSWGEWDMRLHEYHGHTGPRPSSYTRALFWLKRKLTHSDIWNSIWSCHWQEVLLAARIQRQELDRYEPLAFSRGMTRNAHRTATIGALIQDPSICTYGFLREVFVQNYILMGTSNAHHFLGKLRLDGVAAVTLMRILSRYARHHTVNDDIEHLLSPFIFNVKLHCRKSHVLPVLRGCLATLLLNRIRERAALGRTITMTTEEVCEDILSTISMGGEHYDCHRIICGLPYVQEVAAMTRAFFDHSSGVPGLHVSWPLSPAMYHRVSKCAAKWGGSRMERLVLGLLEVSVCGIEHYAGHGATGATVVQAHAHVTTSTPHACSPDQPIASHDPSAGSCQDAEITTPTLMDACPSVPPQAGSAEQSHTFVDAPAFSCRTPPVHQHGLSVDGAVSH